MLQGIGGLIAVHRTFDEDVLREGHEAVTRSSTAALPSRTRSSPRRRWCRASVDGARSRTGSYLPRAARPDHLVHADARSDEPGARPSSSAGSRRLLVLGRVSSLLPSSDNDLIVLRESRRGGCPSISIRAPLALDAVLVDSRLAQKFRAHRRLPRAPRAADAPARARGFAGPSAESPTAVHATGRLSRPWTASRLRWSSGDNPRLTCAAYSRDHLKHAASSARAPRSYVGVAAGSASRATSASTC